MFEKEDLDCVDEQMVIYKYEAKAIRREHVQSELRIQRDEGSAPGVRAIWSNEVRFLGRSDSDAESEQPINTLMRLNLSAERTHQACRLMPCLDGFKGHRQRK